MIRNIRIHADAPPKPAEGEPCNGCGICCSAARCPVAWLFLPLRGEPCPALEWSAPSRSYRCGMVVHPARYLRWLPQRLEPRARGWFAHRIAAGQGCDCGITDITDS